MSGALEEIPLLELASTGSTNDLAWREGRAAFAVGRARACAVRADEQTAGRGRQGRAWMSPRGGLYLSVWLRLDWPPERARLLTLAAGLALREACRDTSGLAPDAKWPNDLLAPGTARKLAGVLTETRVEGGRVSEAVVGMGLNLRTPAPDPGVEVGSPMPVGLDALVPEARLPAVSTLARAAARELVGEVIQLEIGGEAAAARVLDRFRAACAMWGRPVRIAQGSRTVEGEACDVAADGGLVVRLPNGATTVLHTGDVHVVAVAP